MIEHVYKPFAFSLFVVSLLSGQTFTNAVFPSQDPYITYWNGNYYYSDTGVNSIQVRKSPTLTGLAQQVPYTVWVSPYIGPNGTANIWAPEIHLVNGTWYIYFSADYKSNGQHKLYVVQGGADPLGPYVVPDTGSPQGQIVESTGLWAIDPDVFFGADNRLYLTWSCTDDLVGATAQSLCLAEMSDPLHTGSSTVRIATPTEAWETRTGSIEEGPVGFVRNGITYVTYSASASWTPNDYTVGVMMNATGDLLNPQDWAKHGPILDHHGTAYGPGSVVFVMSSDQTELWTLYHGYDSLACAAWACRSIRMQKVAWDEDGRPRLGYPMDPGVEMGLPSGDAGSPTGWIDSQTGNGTSGGWEFYSSSNVDSTPVSGNMQQSFRSDPNLVAYSVSADIAGVSQGGAGTFGIYAVYKDSDNHVEGYLNARNRTFGTASVVEGTTSDLSARTLPSNFDFSATHNLRIDKSAANQFTFYLDGAVVFKQQVGLEHGQIGLFAAGSGAQFRNFNLTDATHGWGDAYGDAAEGLPRNGSGYVHGLWNIVDGASVTSTSLGEGWNTLYQGGPNFGSYSVNVTARLTEIGSTAAQAGLGLIVCHDDRNNEVSLWIHPLQATLDLNMVIQGESSSMSIALPAGFDARRPHTLSATKADSLFTFYLDGVQVFSTSLGLANGTAGVATEDAKASFSGFSFKHQ